MIDRASHPFRFGIHLWDLPEGDWRARVRRYEELGFSTVTLTDHLVLPQWEPLSGLAAIAAVTERIGVGTLVLDAPLRDPVLTAKAAATLQRISGNRLELGLGAGYVAANFAADGRPFEPAPTRLGRLRESVELMTRLWSSPSTTYRGRYYQVTDSPMVSPVPVRPHLLVGGGGRRVLEFGAGVADTVSMIPVQASGQWSVADSLADSTLERMAVKAAWVRQAADAAGRPPGAVELNTMAAKVLIAGDPEPLVAAEAAEGGVSAAALADSSLYLCGTGAQVRAHLQRWRRRTGISYVSVFDPAEGLERLVDEVLGPLTGQ